MLLASSSCETIVCTHGTAACRYEAQAGKRASAKAAADLAREEGCFRYARLEQERELGELVERRIERGFENLAEPDDEERDLLFDGGRERTARLMREASAVGARAWAMPDGGGAAGTERVTGCVGVGMRHLLRNFTQSALPELGDGIDDSARVAGETLPLCRCPVCRRECRCDLFHFFEFPHGLSEAARVACCSALEQHTSMIGAPRAGDGEGEGDLHLELAWARVALLAERLPGELGRYRRYLAAKALAGAFALPAASSVKEAVMDSLRAGVSVSTAEADEADDGDGDNGDTQDEWEEARAGAALVHALVRELEWPAETASPLRRERGLNAPVEDLHALGHVEPHPDVVKERGSVQPSLDELNR